MRAAPLLLLLLSCHRPHLAAEYPSGPVPCDYNVWGWTLRSIPPSVTWGDWNLDRTIDERDMAMMIQCQSGPEMPADTLLVTASSRAYDDGTLETGLWAWDCKAMDVDHDGDVDGVEFAKQQRATGDAPASYRADASKRRGY